MNLIVLIFLSSIFFEGNLQLLHKPIFFPKLEGEFSNVEPYEIQSIKGSLVAEKQTKLSPQELSNTQNYEKPPQASLKNNYPRQKIKYRNNKSHVADKPIMQMDSENAIIDYKRNDTIATQRQVVEIESIVIKKSNDDINLLDSSLNNEDHIDESIDYYTNDTRRLINDIDNIPTPNDIQYNKEIPHDDLKSLQNNQTTDYKNVNINRDLVTPTIDDNSKKDYKTEYIEPTSFPSSNDFNDKLKDDRCAGLEDDEIEEKTDSEDSEQSLRKNTPTNGTGITDLVKSRMMLFNHPRVCYACNSLRDQSCWSPNRRTSVKYCRRDHHSCLIKIYQNKGKPQIIRDCGESCSASSAVGNGPAYASCTVCDSDLCNSADGLVVQNIVFTAIVAINIIFGVFKAY